MILVLWILIVLMLVTIVIQQSSISGLENELCEAVEDLEGYDYDLEQQIDELKKQIVDLKDFVGNLDKAWVDSFIGLKNEVDELKKSTGRLHAFSDLKDLKERLKEALQ